MKKHYFIILFLIISICCMATKYGFAATVGNPLDLDLPQTSAALRQEVIDDTMDEYEQSVKIKTSIDAEFVFGKDLHVNPDLKGAELKGQWYMAKLGMTILNRVEPYIKVGTSNLEVKWKHNAEDMTVGAEYGVAWGGGVKANVLELWDIRLTLDGQYRTTDTDVTEATVGGISSDKGGAVFKVDEWQAGLFLSKKFEIPLKLNSIYVVPYTGVTYADSNVDVSFNNVNSPTGDYSLFDANNKKLYGLVLGCDIVPKFNSPFIYSLELRLVDEIALSLGGTIKF
ncbi:MAG: hypothetical protein Q7O04_03095 [Candidatus Omnitrophota bacterium]|nr:hypothetical protein [Candidatus Omnitrophota bacterium]